jgi:hypothetical protein
MSKIDLYIRETESMNGGTLHRMTIKRPASDLDMVTNDELLKILNSMSHTLDFVPHPRIDDMTDAWFRTEGYYSSEPW